MFFFLAGGLVGWGLFESRRNGPWAWTYKGRRVTLGKEFGERRQANMRNVPRELVGERNVKAFLAVIREKESRGDYRAIVFGGQFQDYGDHPRVSRRRKDGRLTSAAGAYQFTASTWDEVRREMGLADFTPASQDVAALGRIAYRGALPYVVDGFFDVAVAKLIQEWTSLPGSGESGWKGGLDEARAYFVARGGRLSSPAKGQG